MEKERKFTLGQRVIINKNGENIIAHIDWPTIRHFKNGSIRDWFIHSPIQGENLFLCRFTHEKLRTHFSGSPERHLIRKAEYIAQKFIKPFSQ